MKALHQIIRKPLITEKTSLQKEVGQVVVFEVERAANKIEIKQAVEKAFDVKVKNVNTVQIAGKVKRRGAVIGKRANRKKAYVTLEEGSNIDFFGV
ncbi:LSU ribosomal protein L23P [Geoalkalibacter ferrihydriticus]|uniref:Large ribosomal subunit protein uL23 n=2 Tax=Geoalkalibacter ferrihydriticus TaxID=392333 RepID=A0A0C2HWI2_9BACT|nr:50S ribosomal protein L23 [Geoalkalibacter ferrihydriticus]KIH77142.1 50S ribosomal protein L23 [Geoalkalibacter ferrihydriticus DSM 17813]SDL32734.1 LSU ribosomal protein L23P [Geoalkalibacter ferrihydriticus]